MGKGASKHGPEKTVATESQPIIKLSTGKAVLIFGGCGGLGSVLVQTFKNNGYVVVTVDFRISPEADHTIQLSGSDVEFDEVMFTLSKLQPNEFDAIICVAGGFRLGNLKSPDLMNDLQKMFSYNVKSSVAAAKVASSFLKPGGFLCLTGAHAALSPTPGLLAYGISKAATHHLVKSIAQEGSGMPKGSTAIAILPILLDTPQNRKDIPDGKFDDWTPLDTVANQTLLWANGVNRPVNGSMIVLETKNKVTNFVPVKH